jgi:hypothetical protein
MSRSAQQAEVEMSTSANRPLRRSQDAAFLALVTQAFSASFIADANELFDRGERTGGREESDAVPAYVRRVPRDR